MKSIIEVRDIRKEYQIGTQTVRALKGIDLDVAKGEYLALMGPSGSGKSTLMNTLIHLKEDFLFVKMPCFYGFHVYRRWQVKLICLHVKWISQYLSRPTTYILDKKNPQEWASKILLTSLRNGKWTWRSPKRWALSELRNVA